MALKLISCARDTVVRGPSLGWYCDEYQAKKYSAPYFLKFKLRQDFIRECNPYNFTAEDTWWGLVWEEDENEFGPVSP